jgi:hypothetical protein
MILVRAATARFLAELVVAARLSVGPSLGGPVLCGRRITALHPARTGVGGKGGGPFFDKFMAQAPLSKFLYQKVNLEAQIGYL